MLLSDRIEDTEVSSVTVLSGSGCEEANADAMHMAGPGRDAQSRALKNDRKWFARHSWRRFRCRPAMKDEWPKRYGASHTLVMRVSRRQQLRVGRLFRHDEKVPDTDRELAAMLGINTVM